MSLNRVSVNVYIINSQKTVSMFILFLKIPNKEKNKTKIFTQNQLSMKKKIVFFVLVYQLKNR